MFVARPEDLSALMLKLDDKKKFNFGDFTLNLVNLFYSHYYLEEQRTTVGLAQQINQANSVGFFRQSCVTGTMM
jgi:hypothetical protein